MKTLDFACRVRAVDANVMVGCPHDASPDDAILDRQALLAELDDRGISWAVVYHTHASSHGSSIGWSMLRRFIDDDDRLIAQPCASATDGDLRFVNTLYDAGELTSLRLSTHTDGRVDLLPAIYGPLLGFLEKREVPLWIDLWSVELRDLIDTMQRYPQIPLVITGAHYVHQLIVRPLMRAIPRMHLELSRYDAFGEVESLAAEFGAERLIYGSGYPAQAMGTILFYLHHCPSLSDSELAQICSGNVERLLRLERKHP